MKNILLYAVICLLSCACGAQENLYFELRGDYILPIKKAALINAHTLSDLTSGYPANWLNEYVSSDITSTCNGQIRKAQAVNDQLTEEQLEILRTCDLGASITIDVKYKSDNAATGKKDMRNMLYTMKLIPDVEASFQGGESEANKYIQNKVVSLVKDSFLENDRNAAFKFVVNENGAITQPEIIISSGDSNIDQQVLNEIMKMPKWTPAMDVNGIKIQQSFVLKIGNGGC